MKRHYQIVLGVVGATLIGVGAWEHVGRRQAEGRYRQEAQARQTLEQRVSEMLTTHERLKQDLTAERQRSTDLSASLTTARTQLDEMVARLTEETQNVRKLTTRMAAMQQQLDQLQGELVVSLQERQGGNSSHVQLERIVVQEGAAAAMGRVLSIHKDWGFVVINLGWDAVRIGDTVSIVRNDEVMAKARVDRVQEGVCAATILPDWKADTVRVNDTVRVL